MTNPANQMNERLRLEFNEWARAGRGEGMEKGHRPVGEQAIERMTVDADSRVLDLGCGSGWASRLLAARAKSVVGVDISDEMIELAWASSRNFGNVEFKVASAEQLPFADQQFSHCFSMESLYYYEDIPQALREVHRVLESGGQFVCVVDLFRENEPSGQWIEKLKVPVQFLSIEDYRRLFEAAGFSNVLDQRLFDPTPIAETYDGTSFASHADYVRYRAAGSLMITGEG
jgi:ubiquinone/menaquinone biosynthesis C-methylase UbiE